MSKPVTEQLIPRATAERAAVNLMAEKYVHPTRREHRALA